MKKLISGFTLIELLIVIAILGVLASGVWVAIDPVDKINSANDAKSQDAVGQIGGAEEAFATSKSGGYAPGQVDLVTNGDLKVQMAPPATGYAAFQVLPLPAACTAALRNCTSVVVCGTLKSKKYTATPFQVYTSSQGKTCQLAACTTASVCP